MNMKKLAVVLAVSATFNVFLGAFVLGRLSVPCYMPPHGMHHGDHGGGHPMGMFFAPHDGPLNGPDAMDDMPPPPPFFGPGDLFSPQEMMEDGAQVQQVFQQMDALRTGFAKKLAAGPVTKNQVLENFAQIDHLMDGLKKHIQQKAADKISHMPPDARKAFAAHLLGGR